MRAKLVMGISVASAVVLCAAYAVDHWLEADPHLPARPTAAPDGPDSRVVDTDRKAPVEPPVPPSEPPAPERTEASVPHLDESPSTLRLHGSVTIFEHLDVDVPLPPQDGSFDLTVLTSAGSSRQNVPVRSGSFEVEVPPGAELEVRTIRFGDRTAWIRGETRRPIPGNRQLDLIAGCLASRRLDVVDSVDGKELEDVVVLVARTLDEHPGILRPRDVVIDHKPSPIELAPFFARFDGREQAGERAALWVGARDHAFRRIEADFVRGSDSYRVALDRCGSLKVELRGDAAYAKLGLWMRVQAQRAREPYLASYVSFEQPVKIDHLRPGVFAVDVVRGDRSNARSYGGAIAEIEVGRETSVTIEVSQPPEFAAAELPITGTIELPLAWGGPDHMFLERMDHGIVDEKTIRPDSLLLERAQPRTFRFETSTRSPGLWTADVWAGNSVRFGGDFVVGPEGATDLYFAVNEPADLVLFYRDANTGEPVQFSKKLPLHVDWSSSGATTSAWGVENCYSGSGVGFRVPIGPITIQSERGGFAPKTEQFRVVPGDNRHVTSLLLPTGVEISFTVDGTSVRPDSRTIPIVLRSLDGRNATVDMRDDYPGYRAFVDQAGRYEVTVVPLDGYLPVPPTQVQIRSGEMRRLVIPLSRRSR